MPEAGGVTVLTPLERMGTPTPAVLLLLLLPGDSVVITRYGACKPQQQASFLQGVLSLFTHPSTLMLITMMRQAKSWFTGR